MTCVIDFGGTSLCRTESLIQSEIPYGNLQGADCTESAICLTVAPGTSPTAVT